MKLKEFGKFKELKNSINQNDFRRFINDCWNNRYSLYDDSSMYSDEEVVREQQFLIFDGKKVKARNYVGFISYEGENITVYPKVFENIDKEHIDKYLMVNLLYWLRLSDKIKFPIVDTNVDFDNIDSFIEFLIYIFGKYTSNLIYNKPYNAYEEVEEELEFLKGRLNTSKYINNNLATGRWNKFNTVYEPFKFNNKFNQIIKYVSNMLLKTTSNKDSIAYLRQINFILDEVDDVSCSRSDCNEVKLSRLETDYNIVLKFCEMFLSNSSISKSDNDSKLNFCFLVPMEILFEDFIFNFIKKNFEKDLKEIKSQKSNLFLADLYSDDNFISRAFNLRQDIFIKDKYNNPMILDTKYKIIDKNKYPKFGISQSDMYQMTSYAFRGGYKDLGLIYPRVKDFDDNIKYVIKSPFIDDGIVINITIVSFVLDYKRYLTINKVEDAYSYNDGLLYNELEKMLKKKEAIKGDL